MLSMLCAVLAAAQPVKLAAPGLDAVNLDAKMAEFYTSQLAQQLSLQPDIHVVTSSEIGAVLGLSRQKELLGCAEQSCTAELAGALGVDALIVGSVAKVGSAFSLNLKAIAASNAEPLSVVSERAATEDAMIDLLNASARKIAADLRRTLRPGASTDAALETGRAGAPLRLIIPAAVGVALLAVGGVCYGLAKGQEARLLGGDTSIMTRQQYLDVVSSGNTDQTLGFILGSIGLTALVVGVVLYFVGGTT